MAEFSTLLPGYDVVIHHDNRSRYGRVRRHRDRVEVIVTADQRDEFVAKIAGNHAATHTFFEAALARRQPTTAEQAHGEFHIGDPVRLNDGRDGHVFGRVLNARMEGVQAYFIRLTGGGGAVEKSAAKVFPPTLLPMSATPKGAA